MKMEDIVNYCKQYGFIFQGSEIYGGLANTWDYGPLGAELKSNVKKAWLKKFVQEDKNNVGLDSAILMNPKTWEASGHLKTFSDPLIDCKSCKTRHRADKLIEETGVDTSSMTNDDLVSYIKENKIPCPKCGGIVQVRKAKNKRKYYICENNPKSCDYISWNKPTKETK